MLELIITIPEKQALILKGNAREMAEFVHYFELDSTDSNADMNRHKEHVDLNLESTKTKSQAKRMQKERSVSSERPSKRTRILEVLAALLKEGESAPGTRVIVSRFKMMFPDEDATNLDQVLRDLVNKTERVQRAKWGCYSLVSETT